MADLIVGGRRPNPQRNLRGIAIAVVLVLVCALVAYFIYERVVSYTQPGAGTTDHPLVMIEDPTTDTGTRLGFGESSLAHVGTMAVVRMSGQPRFLGAAAGRLLGSGVAKAMSPLHENIAETVPHRGIFGGLAYDVRLRWRYRFLDDGIPGHQLVELASVLWGMQRTTGWAPGYEAFVREQAALDVGMATPWSSNAAFRTMTRALSFTTTLRGPSGDRLLVGRSFAIPGAADAGDAAADHLTISFIKADAVIPFATINWPGLVGVVSGINAEGVAIMVHPVRTRDVMVTRKAQPVTLLARDVLENAHNLDEAINILKHGTPLGAAAFLVVDGTARQWAVVERSPTRFAVDKNGALPIVSDVLEAEVFAEDPENDRAKRIQPATMRKRRVARLLRNRPVEPGQVVAILRDQRDPAGTPLPAGHRGAIYDVSAVHTAIFDASGMVLWVADGPNAGARFRAFDLRYELRGEGARPAPPADLPADPDMDPSVLSQVRLARRALREARRAQGQGNGRRARELVQRALVFAPDLPEALKLAGDLARQSPDREAHDAATRYYERFLEVIPDDLAAEAEVRAVLGR